ncbi:hypothetical protein [Granulicella arctica]|uniref:hypothetical protein n=1 Tax=Granulicella arctica TaxID=940613 RepID=UPI0021E0A1AB|nr:hypothetical protein [Granulicella arctica]
MAMEGSLFSLKVGSTLVPPDWLYQCYTIDARSQHCKHATPYADDIPHAPNETLMTPHSLPPLGRIATIDITPGTGCKVLSISALDAATLNHRKPPTILSSRRQTFSAAPLQLMKTPVLIASIRCNDSMRFRKAAWLLK